MESRKITIVSTRNQGKKIIMSSATTLAELKTDLRAANIDYSGMTFYEGTSKIELKTDDSILPHDIPYKGTITNELVFMLTNTNKKIRSGVMNRAEAYTAIKAANLQAECIKIFGKNYTQCKTSDLIILVEKNNKKAVTTKKTVVTPASPSNPSNKGCGCTSALVKLVNALVGKSISVETANDILAEIGEHINNKATTGYSDSEINEMFKGVC